MKHARFLKSPQSVSLYEKLLFIGSIKAVAFSFTNLFFPPIHLNLLSSGRFLCCLPHFAPTPLRKKRAAKKILSAFESNPKIEDYGRKFHQEAKGRKLSKR